MSSSKNELKEKEEEEEEEKQKKKKENEKLLDKNKNIYKNKNKNANKNKKEKKVKDEDEHSDEKKEDAKLANSVVFKKNWFYSIQNMFLRNPIHSVVPTYNNMLLVHVDMPLYVGLKSFIHKQLSFLLIYDKQIIGHVNQKVLLDYFIYFYNFLKSKNVKSVKTVRTIKNVKNIEKKKNVDCVTEHVMDRHPSDFTFRDMLKISDKCKKMFTFEHTVDCLTVWNFLLKSNEQIVYIKDKTKDIITTTVQTKDLIFYILMNSKGKYNELHSSAVPCLQKNFITVYQDFPLSEVLLLMHTHNLTFVPILKRANDTYLNYFSLDDYFALCKKTFLENWNIEPQKCIILFVTILRNDERKLEETKTKEMKQTNKKNKTKNYSVNIIPPLKKMFKMKKETTNENNFVKCFTKKETIINNQDFTIKNTIQSLFYSKINSTIVLSEKGNQVDGIVTFQSLFEYLQHC